MVPEPGLRSEDLPPEPGVPQPSWPAVRAQDEYPPARPEPLPVEPRQYFEFYRAPAFRWWKPLVAILLAGVAWLAASVVAVVAALVWDFFHGGKLPTDISPTDISALATPAVFLATNLADASALPIALLIHWLVYRQRPRWLSSIAGGFRWRLFGRFALIAFSVMAVFVAVSLALSDGFGSLVWTPDSLFLILTVVLTTPFQCAGEEYLVRGLLARSVGSWFANRWVGLGAAALVNGIVFMLLHGAGDPWLNTFYLLFASLATAMVWRTGGLEAAVALHVANNVVTEALLPFTRDGLESVFSRAPGAAGPQALIQMAVIVLIAGLIWWRASRLRLPRAFSAAGDRPHAGDGGRIVGSPGA